MRLAAPGSGALIQRLTVFAAALAGAALVYGLLTGQPGADMESTITEKRRGYYLADAVLSEMGQDGKPRIVVHAKSIEQQVSDDSVQMSDLHVDFAGEQAGQWVMTARQGHMTPDYNTLLVSGDVRITGDAEHGSAVITTDALSYDTRANFVQTAQPVNVLFGAHVLNGRGLRADLNAGTLRLESNVNGRFTP